MDVDPQHYEAMLDSLRSHPLPDWYQDAKLGIFVHWGLYSVPGWAASRENLHRIIAEGGFDKYFRENRMRSGISIRRSSRMVPLVRTTTAASVRTSPTKTSSRSSSRKHRSGCQTIGHRSSSRRAPATSC